MKRPKGVARPAQLVAKEVRVRGRVQGVGFRPTVWRIARDLGLSGEVLNDARGVLVRVGGTEGSIATFIDRLEREPPPLGRIDRIEIEAFCGNLPHQFSIAESVGGAAHTQVAPDAAICTGCAEEIKSPFDRRFRYPFANCTHCGPRLSIVNGVPFDRARTTMAPFTMCEACGAEYRDPADRRFHAQAIACHTCGPKATLRLLDGGVASLGHHSLRDSVDAVVALIRMGEIVAVKGLGGYHLACDATNADTVTRLRRLKRRDAKPFAVMARDLDAIRSYCLVGGEAERQLAGPSAPIVLLDAEGSKRLPEAIAPGLSTIGFMLPITPLHVLILQDMNHPVVMTSGNLAGEPPVIDDAAASDSLAQITPYALVHDREIANRVDDSVVRVMAGRARIFRRARGFAPAPIPLPSGFEAAPELLAMGGQLKATFCLVKDGAAILSQHQGDLEEAATFNDYRKNLALYTELFNHTPVALVADLHPEYLSSKLARERAQTGPFPLMEVQHHHAHIAACLAENGRALNAPAVLGVVLDGLGWGDDGTFWGGEFLLADYRRYERLGTFRPVSMLGGAHAAREPWRNLYAHLVAGMGWDAFALNFAGLDLYADLSGRPRTILEAMIRNGINTPKASSCGRLFDAVAAALDICRERQAYEGDAAARLEAMVDQDTLRLEDDALCYPLSISNLSGPGLPRIEPLAMWQAILEDLVRKTPAPVVAARFHKGLAKSVVAMATNLARRDDEGGPRFDTVALSGGCFQNRILFEEVTRRLEQNNFVAFSHAQVPANDGGLALGQAAIGAAHLIDANTYQTEGNVPCASGFQAAS
jgi:hydrogenase maturation protein HypF